MTTKAPVPVDLAMREVIDEMRAPGPTGIHLYDAISGRAMLYIVDDGHPNNGWLCYRHPDGQWVTLRKATDGDIEQIGRAFQACKLHHVPKKLRVEVDLTGPTFAPAPMQEAASVLRILAKKLSDGNWPEDWGESIKTSLGDNCGRVEVVKDHYALPGDQRCPHSGQPEDLFQVDPDPYEDIHDEAYRRSRESDDERRREDER